MLPKGQYQIEDLPRFGMTQYATRFPTQTERVEVELRGEIEAPSAYSAEFQALPRRQITADFHCVTTWSCLALTWEGVRFRDYYEGLVVPLARPAPGADFVMLRGQDGYRASLPLAFLLAENVLLADRLNGEPLSLANGAPLRLVAPDHYGYKSVKHLSGIEFLRQPYEHLPPLRRFMVHPTARVAREERGRFLPNWFLRRIYRRAIAPTRAKFQSALAAHLSAKR